MFIEKIEILITIHRILPFGVSDIIIQIFDLELKDTTPPPNSALGVYNTMKVTQILAPN